MQFRTITRRASVVASATTLLSAATFGGSNAGAMLVGGGVVVAITPPGSLHNVSATLSYDATPFPGGAFVEFNCKAVAWVDPASTGIDTCSINGVEAIGSPNNLPGAVSAAAGVVWVPDGSKPVGCVGAHASFIEGILGPRDKSTPTECDTLSLVLAVPVAVEGSLPPLTSDS